MFRKYRCSEIYTLNNNVNEILPLCSKFFVRFGCKSIQEMCVEMYWEIASSVNVLGDGELRGNVWEMASSVEMYCEMESSVEMYWEFESSVEMY